MKKRSSRSPLFEVRHSPIHGYGVFALRRIRKGTTVTEYVGDRVSHEEADARYENKDPNDNHTFLFTVDSKTVIDGGVGGNDARFINHGCDPNCESSTQNKRIFVEAIRTIQPGEELAYDYQIERDPDDPPNVDAIFACRCGAAKCRGSMLVAPKKKRGNATRPKAKRSSKTGRARQSGKSGKSGKTRVKSAARFKKTSAATRTAGAARRSAARQSRSPRQAPSRAAKRRDAGR